MLPSTVGSSTASTASGSIDTARRAPVWFLCICVQLAWKKKKRRGLQTCSQLLESHFSLLHRALLPVAVV